MGPLLVVWCPLLQGTGAHGRRQHNVIGQKLLPGKKKICTVEEEAPHFWKASHFGDNYSPPV